MSNSQGRSQSITVLAFLSAVCLLLSGIASAAPSITLSKTTGPPTSRIIVSGRGFTPNASVDIYFDTKDEAVAVANSTGAFSQIAIPAPASALTGDHWVSAVERSGDGATQARFDVQRNWRQFHRLNMQRMNPFENVLNVHNVGNLILKWKFTTGSAVFSSPAVANGAVYVGSDDTYVYALNASTGAKLWSYATAGVVSSSPTVANGVVYVGGGYLNDNVYALNADTGAKLWSYATGNQVESSPAVANGVVYVGSDDTNVYALNASTGAKLWTYYTGCGEYCGVVSSPAVAKGMVYVGSYDNRVYALNAHTGAKLWSYPTDGYVFSSPAVENGVVYFGSDNGRVYALDARTGAKMWVRGTGAHLWSSPAVAKGVVYVGSYDHNVYALNARTGAGLWSYATNGQVWSSPAVANGVVYVGSKNQTGGYSYVYALNAKTGALLWSYATGSWVASSPAVANGVLYVGSYDRNVYAFGLPYGRRSKQNAASKRPDLNALHPDFSLKASKPVATRSGAEL
jgi:outer membrane protein assembly factor BamB